MGRQRRQKTRCKFLEVSLDGYVIGPDPVAELALIDIDPNNPGRRRKQRATTSHLLQVKTSS